MKLLISSRAVSLLAMSVLVLGGCKQATSLNSSIQGPGGNGTQQLSQCGPGVDCATNSIDQTDISSCFKPATTAPHLDGSWKSVHFYPDFAKRVTMNLTIDVQNLKLMVSNVCEQENIPVIAETAANIQLLPSQIQVQANSYGDHQQTTLPSGKTLFCEATIKTGGFKYSLTKGGCLVLTGTGPRAQSLMLVPN